MATRRKGDKPKLWSVPAGMWEGETVFIVAGGPSFNYEDARKIVGRRVIAINSAWEVAPFAEMTFFGDGRWYRGDASQKGKAWAKSNLEKLRSYSGILVSSDPSMLGRSNIRTLGRVAPPAWSNDPTRVTMSATSVTGAMNIATLAGAARIVLCGVDGKKTKDRVRHNHGAAYPWPFRPNSWDRHKKEFWQVRTALLKIVDVVNCNLDSYHDAFPREPLDKYL